MLFGELLVDLIWTVDAELDDIYQDSKVALLNAEQGNGPIVADGVDATAVLARVAKAKQTAEADKETLAGTVNLLVVRNVNDVWQLCLTVHIRPVEYSTRTCVANDLSCRCFITQASSQTSKRSRRKKSESELHCCK